MEYSYKITGDTYEIQIKKYYMCFKIIHFYELIWALGDSKYYKNTIDNIIPYTKCLHKGNICRNFYYLRMENRSAIIRHYLYKISLEISLPPKIEILF
jgi:hypothetical protein